MSLETDSSKTKTTLGLDKMFIRSTAKHAKDHAKPATQPGRDRFPLTKHETRNTTIRLLGSKTVQLYGCLKGIGISGEEYGKHLKRKYR